MNDGWVILIPRYKIESLLLCVRLTKFAKLKLETGGKGMVHGKFKPINNFGIRACDAWFYMVGAMTIY